MKCDAIRGMERWQPSCSLPAGHDGPHEWLGLSTAVERLRSDNIRTWLEHEAVKLATEGQQARYARGELPEEEILTIARAVLFKPFGEFERWSKSHAIDAMTKALKHAVFCKRNTHPTIGTQATALTSDDATAVELSNLAALRSSADGARLHPWIAQTGGTVEVQAQTHWVFCTCEAEIARSSAKVTITWGERELVREYAL